MIEKKHFQLQIEKIVIRVDKLNRGYWYILSDCLQPDGINYNRFIILRMYFLFLIICIVKKVFKK